MFLRGARRATWLPLFPTLIGIPFIAVAIMMKVNPLPPSAANQNGPPPDPNAWLMFGGIGVAILGYGVLKIRRFARIGDTVLVRGLGLKLELRPTVGTGYTMRGNAKWSAIYIYFVDGTTPFDVITMLPYRPQRAAAIAKELAEILDLAPTAAAERKAAQDDAAITSARAQVDAYYASPRHKRVMWILGIGVLLYVAVMGIITNL